MTWKFLLCICILFVATQTALADRNRLDLHRKHENDVSNAPATGVFNQDKPKRLFARTRYLSHQRPHMTRPKPEPAAPARQCAGLMESCSAHTPCCDPCAFCHCRLFNTICHCWRLGHSCLKKT
ncbi:agouti-signaling protein 2b [Chanos chanos]|uniref:Agouti-signaling protein 2b n=1 Tax=Chanos chanos TaxID=29144 RepID=A0A6J2VCP3_CHACN|nr:agouti-signaling protein-like [Chanos chanos]